MKKNELAISQILSMDLSENRMDCNNSFKPFPSGWNCLECERQRICWFQTRKKEYETLCLNDRIVAMTNDLYQMDLFDSFIHRDLKTALDTMLQHEIGLLEKESQVKQHENLTTPENAILLPDDLKRIDINGDLGEIGMILGNFMFNTLNAKGDHLFRTDCVTLAKWVCLIFKPLQGKELKFLTMVEYLARGRNSGKNSEN